MEYSDGTSSVLSQDEPSPLDEASIADCIVGYSSGTNSVAL